MMNKPEQKPKRQLTSFEVKDNNLMNEVERVASELDITKGEVLRRAAGHWCKTFRAVNESDTPRPAHVRITIADKAGFGAELNSDDPEASAVWNRLVKHWNAIYRREMAEEVSQLKERALKAEAERDQLRKTIKGQTEFVRDITRRFRELAKDMKR